MGNAHSAHGAHQHPHNRLSKPKTNRDSPPLAPRVVESPGSVTSRYAHLSSRDRHQIKTQLLSPVEKEFDHTASPTGDEDVSELATHLQRRLSGESRANSLSCFGSTRGSATKLTSLPGSKVSLVSNSQIVDLETAIKIVQEVKRNASPEDLAALHEALQSPAPAASPRESPAPGPALSRRNSLLNRSTSSLIRRRSLVTTPGVATRNSGVENIRRTWNSWKTPKLDPEEEAKWSAEKMGKSPLTRLAALDLEEGRSSPTPRAQTPGEMDYAHLGSFQLGSLRVTNGPASPTPSAKFRRRRSNPNLFSEGDYFTPSEPSDSPIMMKPTKRRGHARSKSTLMPPTPPLYRKSLLSDQVRRAKTLSRCDSPSKPQVQDGPIFDETESEPVRRLRVMNKSADTLADTLAMECPPTLPSDYDEGYVADERESFQDEAFNLFNGTIFAEPAPVVTLQDPEKEVTKPVKSPTSFKRFLDRPFPQKADSGYSSAGSFRTVRGGSPDEGTASALKKPLGAADFTRSGSSDSETSSSLHTFDHMARSTAPEKTSPPGSASGNVASSPITLQVPHTGASQPSSPIGRITDVQTLCESPTSPGSMVTQHFVDNKRPGSRRLQKKRPSFQELPVVQSCEPAVEGTVPSVPADVRHKFTRRLSETPNMDCLTQTYKSTEHVTDDTSSSVTTHSIRAPSPPLSFGPLEQQPNRSVTERPSSSRSSIRRSLSFFRNTPKSKKLDQEMEQSREAEEAPPIELDLGSIAMSLGQSPYDAAMAPTRRKSMTTPKHPHQLGNALPRTRSMVNMDAETAIEFARMRSKDRAISRPSMPPRPRSFHAIYRRIPHDLYEDIPDVPPIPPLPVAEADKVSVPHVPEPVQPYQAYKPSQVYQPVKPYPAYQPYQYQPVQPVEPVESVELPANEEAHPSHGASFRARTTGLGPVVSEMVQKFDQHGNAIDEQAPVQDWQPHAQLWRQRRKSIGEDMRNRAEQEQAQALAWEQLNVPQLPAKYTGDGIRQLHSYASRRRTRRSVNPPHVPRLSERA